MKYAVRSFIGTRKVQEDCADCIETEKGLFAVVCDGIGSRANGGASSRMTVRFLTEQFHTHFSGDFPSFITEAAEEADRAVYEAYGNRCGTTAVAAYVSGNSLYWLSVGDSRLYILRSGQMKQITTDHNYRYVLELRLKKHLIDEAAYQNELKKSGQLASFIGMGGIDLVDVSMKPLTLKKGDILLLTTDGLYKPLAEDKIYAIITSGKNPETIADELVDAVQKCDGPLDNTTFALLFYDKTEEL